MLQIRPTRENPIYVEWKKWFYICANNYSKEAADAKASIERIAEHAYKGQNNCIVGTLIMMKDTEEIEAEESSQAIEQKVGGE